MRNKANWARVVAQNKANCFAERLYRCSEGAGANTLRRHYERKGVAQNKAKGGENGVFEVFVRLGSRMRTVGGGVDRGKSVA